MSRLHQTHIGSQTSLAIFCGAPWKRRVLSLQKIIGTPQVPIKKDGCSLPFLPLPVPRERQLGSGFIAGADGQTDSDSLIDMYWEKAVIHARSRELTSRFKRAVPVLRRIDPLPRSSAVAGWPEPVAYAEPDCRAPAEFA